MIRAVGLPTVLLAGGGTGGHLFPGVATAEALVRRAPGARALLATTGRDEGTHYGAACAIEQVRVDSPERPRSALGVPAFAVRMAGAVARSLRLMRDAQVDVVVGLGGYGSVAPVLAARMTGRPVVLLEQNAVAGRATRLLARFAAFVAVSFGDTRGLSQRTVRHTGNPVRRTVLATRAAHAEFGLSPAAPVLGVLGGSLGARGVSERFAAALPAIADATAGRRGTPLQVIHATGNEDGARRFTRLYHAHGVRASARPFFEDMGAVYGTADALLCRAGGTTVAEVAAVGLPAVFVPYPHHRDGHQRANASVLVAHGAATLLEERDMAPEAVLAALQPLLLDDSLRERRARAARCVGQPDAADRVAELVVGVAHGPGRVQVLSPRAETLSASVEVEA